MATAKAISTLGIQLLCGASASALKELCRIKDYPDLIGAPNTIDVTDLQDEQQTFIPGIKTSDTMSFTANYTKESYDAVEALAGQDKFYAIRLSDGSGWSWQGQHTLGVPGHGVDEPVEFTVNCTNSTPVVREDTVTVSPGE